MENIIKEISNSNVLVNSFFEARKNCSYKNSVQEYEINLLKNIRKTQLELRNDSYKQKDFYDFYLNERGKERYIRAINIYDRVVQRALCDRLCKIINPLLIYDNGASVKNKGISFSRRRLETHLHKFYRKYGNDGYILLIDFRKFFDNINHDKLMDMYREKISDEGLLSLMSHLINSFSVDISDYNIGVNDVFDSLSYSRLNCCKNGKKFLNKSLGIGSQISQISGLYYPHKIDNYCKIVKSIKYYGRYMDDTYIISNDKNYLRKILVEINDICKELGIFINFKKTHILKINKGFTFLKIKYRLNSDGHLIRRPDKYNITREKRKLKSFKRLLDCGDMTIEEISNQYYSWRGNILKYDGYKSIVNSDLLFNSLFFNYLYSKYKWCYLYLMVNM